jgi:hypothetical protein
MVAVGAREALAGPGHLQGAAIQKLHGGNVLIHGLWGEFALIEQVELILPDGLDIEFCGAFAEVLGKTGHVRDILPLCAGCEIAQLHIVDHALP